MNRIVNTIFMILLLNNNSGTAIKSTINSPFGTSIPTIAKITTPHMMNAQDDKRIKSILNTFNSTLKNLSFIAYFKTPKSSI